MNTPLVKRSDRVSKECITLVARLRVLQASLGADYRLELWSELMADYCRHCGYLHPKDHQCQCWNDE